MFTVVTMLFPAFMLFEKANELATAAPIPLFIAPAPANELAVFVRVCLRNFPMYKTMQIDKIKIFIIFLIYLL